MESDQNTSKEIKVEIPLRNEVVSSTIELQGGTNVGQGGGLMRQPSMTKTNCLCSPTTHPGSFRCRLHRTPSLQRTKSMEPESIADNHGSIVDADKDRIH
ncbi:uncharacterized protein [Cicer arietinum]|uniref:Uncharacterized protein LOC101491177 n=1 Tax=Cicer arietinum TaxID=3827 RepID=A0A1S2YTI5_CICAR|nr:uncharacterized protein LOC101491177 [Cicer arietinum]